MSEHKEHMGVRYHVGPSPLTLEPALHIVTRTGSRIIGSPEAIADPVRWIEANREEISGWLAEAERHHAVMLREYQEKGPGTSFNRARGHLS